MSGLRFTFVVAIASALVAIVYMGASGERWPLGFVGATLAGTLIIGAGEALLGRDED